VNFIDIEVISPMKAYGHAGTTENAGWLKWVPY